MVVDGTGCLRQMCDRPIIVGIFQGLTDGLIFLVTRNVAKITVLNQTSIVIGECPLSPKRVGFFVINAGNSFRVCFSQHGSGVIADHAAGFAGLEGPYRYSGWTLLCHPNHGVEHVGQALSLNQRIERMQSTVGIPQRES